MLTYDIDMLNLDLYNTNFNLLKFYKYKILLNWNYENIKTK